MSCRKVVPSRSLRSLALGVGLTSYILAASAAAHAQPVAETSIEYRFDPDELDGDSLFGDAPSIVLRPQAARVLLIRPRTHFLPELYKSIEDM